MVCVQQSAGKIMATVFWDPEGVLLLEFMPHKATIIGDTYASTMVALCENMKQKQRGNLSAGVLLLHDYQYYINSAHSFEQFNSH